MDKRKEFSKLHRIKIYKMAFSASKILISGFKIGRLILCPIKKLYRILRISVCFFGSIFLFSCGAGELGDQPPENVTIMASMDGSIIIRQYKIYTISSYIQDGGKTERQGSVTNYLEVYSGKTGQLVSARTFPIKQNCQLLKVTDSHAWLSVYNKETNKSELLVIRIPVFSKAFDEKLLSEKNNGLIFKTNLTYYNLPDFPGVVLEADDARIYAVNETTGLATMVPDTVETRMIDSRFLQLRSLNLQDRNMSFTGNQRKKLTVKMNDRKKTEENILSESDFINPYIVGYYNSQLKEELPLTIDNSFLVVSKTKDNNTFEFQFTLLDSVMVKKRWTATLLNQKGENNENNLFDIQLQGNDILVITKHSMSLLDTQSGEWKWNKTFD